MLWQNNSLKKTSSVLSSLMFYFSVLVFMISLTSFAGALVDNVKIYYSGTNETVEYGSMALAVSTDVKVTLNTGDLLSLTADLTGMSVEGYRKDYSNIQVNTADCEVIASGKTACLIPNIDLLLRSLNQKEIELKFKGTSVEGNFNDAVNKSIKLDNTRPKAISMLEENCNEEPCYVNRGRKIIIADIQEEESGLKAENVRMKFDRGGSFVAYKCEEGWKCYFNATIPSLETGKEFYSFIIGGNDKTGNLFERGQKFKFIYDNTLPEPVSMKWYNDKGFDVVGGGDTAFLEIKVKESSPLEATANFSGFGLDESSKVNCETDEKNATFKICKWDIANVPEGYKTSPVQVRFKDKAGNFNSKTYSLEILEKIDTTGKEINFWEIEKNIVSPTSINKKMLKYFPKKVYQYLSLKKKKGNVEAVKVDFEGCIPRKTNKKENKTEKERWGSALNTAGEFTFKISNNQFGSTEPLITYELRQVEPRPGKKGLDYTCRIGIITKQGKKIYPQKEFEEFPLRVTYYESQLFNDKIKDEIEKQLEDQQKKVEKLNQDLQFVNLMVGLCQMAATGTAGTGIMGSTQSLLASTPYTAPAANAMMPATQASHEFFTKMYEATGGQNGFCDYFTCNADWQEKIRKNIFGFNLGNQKVQDFMNELSKSFGGGNTEKTGINPVSPMDNIIVAAATACIPGYVYGQQKMTVIDCGYTQCLAEDVPAGYPVSECKKIRSYGQCRYVVGEIWNAIPYTALYSRIVDTVHELVRDPFSAIGLVLAYGCKGALGEGAIAHGICTQTGTLKSFAHMIDSIKQMMFLYQNIQHGPLDSCENILDSLDGFDSIYQTNYPGGIFCDNAGKCVDRFGNAVTSTLSAAQSGLNSLSNCASNPNTGNCVKYSSEVTAALNEAGYTYDNGVWRNSQGGYVSPSQIQNAIKTYAQEHPQSSIAPIATTQTVTFNCGGNTCYAPADLYQAYVTNAGLNAGELFGEYNDALKAVENAQKEFNSAWQELVDSSCDEESSSCPADDEAPLKKANEAARKLEEAKQKLAQAQKKAKEKARQMEVQKVQNLQGWDNFRFYLEMAYDFHSISSLFFGEDDFKGYRKFWDDIFANKIFNLKEMAYSKICDADIDRDTVGAFMVMSATGFRPGAHIEAERQGPTKTPKGQEYNYLVSATVQPPQKPGLTFDIILMGDGIKKINKKPIVLQAGQPYTFGGENSKFVTDKRLYTQACIQFRSNVADYYREAHLDGNRICARIMGRLG